MTQGKISILVLVGLILGFGLGFILRPMIAPAGCVPIAANPAPAAIVSATARSTQYFAANLDDARRVVVACTEGSVRGGECAKAEQAVTEADGRDRFKKFMAHK